MTHFARRSARVAWVAGSILGAAVFAGPVAAYTVVTSDVFVDNLMPGWTAGFTLRAHETDSASDALSFEVDDPPQGSVQAQAPTTCFSSECWQEFTYSPDTAFAGEEVFGFTARSIDGTTATGYIHLTFVPDTVAPVFRNFFLAGVGQTGWANSVDVTAYVDASDDRASVTAIRLSNSATTSGGLLTKYIEFEPNSAGVAWSLQNATGGSSTVGTHRVYAQVSDDFGNWSSVTSATIKLDPYPPVISSVGISFQSSSDSSIPIKLTFNTTDTGGSGTHLHEVWESRDGGGWTYVTETSQSYFVVRDSSSHTYRYRVRAQDFAGSWSGWKYTITFRPYRYGTGSSSVHYSGPWGTVVYAGLGISSKYSTANGATVSLTFTGRSIGWSSVKGPKRGKAAVYVDGSYVKTVDLLYSTTKLYALVYSKNWSSSSKHTIKIKVLGTSGRPRVEFLLFQVLR